MFWQLQCCLHQGKICKFEFTLCTYLKATLSLKLLKFVSKSRAFDLLFFLTIYFKVTYSKGAFDWEMWI